MIIPTGFAQMNLKILWPVTQQRAEITLGLDVSTYPSSVVQACTDALSAYNTSALKAMMNTVGTLDTIDIKFGPNATGPSYSKAAGVIGTRTGSAATPQVAALVQKHTLLGGHKGKGRCYWAPISEGDVDDYGTYASSARTALDAAWASFRTALIGFDLIPVLLHSDPADTPDQITAFTSDSVCATQRRRLRS